MAYVIVAILGLVMYFTADTLASMYTNIDDLQQSVAGVLRFYAFYY
jgi:hypothetical protein